MENKYTFEEPEQLDALDNLIIDELGHQQRLRHLMQLWDQQQQTEDPAALALRQQEQRRRARRLRLVPIVSNILSVAALMTVGFIIQSLLPTLNASTTASSADDILPAIEQVLPTTPSSSAVQTHVAVPADSAAAE